MRVSLRQKNLEITPALNSYIETKILKPLRRLLGTREKSELPILELEVGRSTFHHQKGKVYYVSAIFSFGGKAVQARGEAEDIHQACDLLEEELKKEIVGYQSKSRALDKRVARKIKKDLRLDPAARMYRKGRIRDEGN